MAPRTLRGPGYRPLPRPAFTAPLFDELTLVLLPFLSRRGAGQAYQAAADVVRKARNRGLAQGLGDEALAEDLFIRQNDAGEEFKAQADKVAQKEGTSSVVRSVQDTLDALGAAQKPLADAASAYARSGKSSDLNAMLQRSGAAAKAIERLKIKGETIRLAEESIRLAADAGFAGANLDAATRAATVSASKFNDLASNKVGGEDLQKEGEADYVKLTTARLAVQTSARAFTQTRTIDRLKEFITAEEAAEDIVSGLQDTITALAKLKDGPRRKGSSGTPPASQAGGFQK